MAHLAATRPTPLPAPMKWRAVAPVATLIFLSPVLTELLAGVLRVTTLWLLIPEMAVYGLAAVLIREVARRSQRGWGTILLLGLAFGVAEECVILQTSLTPQFFPAGTASFGWAAGVQWIYLIALVIYESVYAIVISIALAELLFPDRRNDSWLTRRAIVVAGVVLALSSVGVWWLWSHVGLQRFGPTTYQAPPITIALALVAIVALIGVGLALPRRRRDASTEASVVAMATGANRLHLRTVLVALHRAALSAAGDVSGRLATRSDSDRPGLGHTGAAGHQVSLQR
jgi:hypothetical protein